MRGPAVRRVDALPSARENSATRALMTLIAGVSPQAAENADIWQGRAILFEGGRYRWIG